MSSELSTWISREADAPVEMPVNAVIEAVKRRFGASVGAILFYGSCLRSSDFADSDEDAVLDLYVLVDRYRDVHGGWFSASLNALLPPNVYYFSVQWQNKTLRAKVALMTLAQFQRGASRRAFLSSIWGRFSQPVRIGFVRSAIERNRIVEALVDAVVTTVACTAPLVDNATEPRHLWIRAFKESYRTEIRAERAERAVTLFEFDAERYEALTPWALAAIRENQATGGLEGVLGAFGLTDRLRAQLSWGLRRCLGKLVSIARLAKAVFTFEGGVDYVIWKIERHSGVRPQLTDWQRRHPILASPAVLLDLYRKGALR